jgi:rhodanese-related sulfurtransferase
MGSFTPRALAFVFLTLAGPTAVRAQNVLEATLAEPGQATPEISTADMRRILSDGSAIVLDTRSRAQFAAGHIPGARNIDAPAAEMIAAVERLVGGDKSKALALTCNGPFCEASRRAGEQLAKAGFTNVRRYQLGIPVWRAFGGPTEIELEGAARIFGVDRSAIWLDARPAADFAAGSVAGAFNAPAVQPGALEKLRLPNDDFNRRLIIFGAGADDARTVALTLSKKPWANAMYFAGGYAQLAGALKGK